MQQFRTTISAVFWTETPAESEGIGAAVAALLPADDQAATLSTVEYIAAGRPAAPTALPPAPVVEEVQS
jgi:hypothetical protein